MEYVIEGVMLFAAMLADLWLGNYGLLPCFTVYVLFHASRSVSLRFATVAALFLGILIDAVYCRWSSASPLWFTVALYAGWGCLGKSDRDDEGSDRVFRVIFSGAAIGIVLTVYRFAAGAGAFRAGLSGAAVDLLAGALSGVLKLTLTVLLLDLICNYLGVRGFFPPDTGGRSGANLRRRRRRVRAVNVGGRGR